MIKRCPTCNRTYSDESISFCLADGALLSAPYDGAKEEPPPTEVLPPVHNLVPPTEAAKPPIPTMTSLPGAQKYSPLADTQPKKSPRLVWAVMAVLAVVVILIGAFAARSLFSKKSEVIVSSTPEGLIAQNSPESTATPLAPAVTTSTADIARTKPTATPTVGPNIVQPAPEPKNSSTPPPATLQADPVLFPPDTRPSPKEPASVDYNRVFSQKEVDTRLRLLSKPSPSYTDAARQNNVQGKVVLRVIFSADGSVGSVTPMSGLPYGLTERAIAAARQIKFQPAMKDGRAVSVSMLVEYNFSVY